MAGRYETKRNVLFLEKKMTGRCEINRSLFFLKMASSCGVNRKISLKNSLGAVKTTEVFLERTMTGRCKNN